MQCSQNDCNWKEALGSNNIKRIPSVLSMKSELCVTSQFDSALCLSLCVFFSFSHFILGWLPPGCITIAHLLLQHPKSKYLFYFSFFHSSIESGNIGNLSSISRLFILFFFSYQDFLTFFIRVFWGALFYFTFLLTVPTILSTLLSRPLTSPSRSGKISAKVKN